jgi:hypothetical protein
MDPDFYDSFTHGFGEQPGNLNPRQTEKVGNFLVGQTMGVMQGRNST